MSDISPKENEQEQEWFTVTEVAAIFEKTTRTIQRWVNDGYFPNAKLTGPYLNSPKKLPKSDIDDLKKRLGHID